MVDYYSLLLPAVTAPDAGDARWRHHLYDRARRMLSSQLRARRPPAPLAEIAAEQAALEAAIERIEAEMTRAERSAIPRDEASGNRDRDISSEPRIGAKSSEVAAPFRLSSTSWTVVAVVAAALAAGAYILWAQKAQKSAPPPSKVETRNTAPAPPAVRATSAAKDGDLAPGVDGGSSDADMPYVFRRQPTFYRTLEPAGTVIIDKLQHFLYLIQPNNVALRYGIGLGQRCTDLVGLHKIASKAEWPAWQPPPDMIERKLARPGTMPGGQATRSARACSSLTTASPVSTAPTHRRPSAPT
jgi:lipoprotein-anchoring transpeptidase ErfK/SrfK